VRKMRPRAGRSKDDGRRARQAEARAGVRGLALEILSAVEEGASLDRLMEDRLFNTSLDTRDRALGTHIIQGTLRFKKYLDWGIAQYLKGDLQDLPPPIRNTLRLAFYQLLFLDRIPAWAVVNEHVSLASVFGHGGTAGLVNAVLRSFLRADRHIAIPETGDPVARIAIETSHPEWMIRRWVDRYGEEEARELASANNRIPKLSVRVNRRRTTPEALARRFAEVGIEVTPGRFGSGTLILDRSSRVPGLPGFAEGWFQVQDDSSALVGLLAAPRSGEQVIDLCSGVGGKTSHLADLAGDESTVVGVDRAMWRLRKLRENCDRLGLHSVFEVCGDVVQPCVQPSDIVVLDAPCSGTGVLARRADARWKRREEDVPRLARLQETLLEAASPLVKTGGSLVYSVCSMEPEECEDVVRGFLKTNREFELHPAGEFLEEAVVSEDGYLRTTPHHHGIDGIFAARMRKAGSRVQ